MVVLVVEDEAFVNWTTCEALTDAGYEAIAASNADEAIEILESRSDIDVLFTDVDMPGSLDGIRLAAAVRDRWPPVHIIVTSGKHTPAKLPERAVFVPKPYRHDKIVDTLAAF